MLDVLDGDAIRSWLHAAYSRLVAARDEIDRLNVYPVPDGDTGTNLTFTLQAVVDADAPAGQGAAARLEAAGRSALMGARGNSGVIVSQILRGFAEAAGGAVALDGALLVTALRTAADAAYLAVAEPVEGTILTVARAAAGAAEAAEQSGATAAGQIATAALAGAQDALARTPEQLDVLARAGVVDAGGRGLVVVLEALCAAAGVLDATAVMPHTHVVDRSGGGVAREAGSSEYGYEVQYLLDAADEALPTLRTALRALGDSLVTVGGGGLWNVHVHVNDVGAAIEAGVEAGRPHRITVTRFADQIGGGAQPEQPLGARVLAVAPGPALGRLFSDAGAAVVDGGPGACPSTGHLVAALRVTGAHELAVLPNDRNIRAVAEQAAGVLRDDGISVAVIPTRSVVQGLAAMAVHDPDRRYGPDVIAMTAAAVGTRVAEVVHATRDARTEAGDVAAGDVLGLLDGEVVAHDTNVLRVACELLDRLLIGGGELVTLVSGEQAAPDLVEQVTNYLRASRPHVEISAYDGGQPHYPLLIGVE